MNNDYALTLLGVQNSESSPAIPVHQLSDDSELASSPVIYLVEIPSTMN